MNNIEANQCAFCKEIWNNDNMKILPLKHKVFVCPECYDNFVNHYIDSNVIKQIRGDVVAYSNNYDYDSAMHFLRVIDRRVNHSRVHV